MISYPNMIQRLIDELKKLPGVGPKSAQRLAFYLLGQPVEEVGKLAELIDTTRKAIRFCSECCNLTDKDPCSICSQEARNRSIICVVEEPKDVMAIEKSRDYKGLYHVLHGAINPINGIGPSDIRIRELINRLAGADVQEIIIATNLTIEGDSTALYIARLLRDHGIKITRIAHGIPVGGDLDYADELTISRAIQGRREL